MKSLLRETVLLCISAIKETKLKKQGTIKGKVFFNLKMQRGFTSDLQSKLCLYYSFVFAKYHILEKYV